MAKYSTEFKKKIVAEYLKGNIGYGSLAKKYNIPSMNPVQPPNFGVLSKDLAIA